MKKNVSRVLSLILTVILVLSLAGCGPIALLLNDSEPTPTPEPVSTPTPEPDSAPEATETPSADSEPASESSKAASSGNSDAMYESVRDFLSDNRDLLDASIEEITGTMEGMSVSLEGTSNTLIYYFTFSDEIMAAVPDEDALKAALDEGLADEDFADVFEEIAASVRDVVEPDDVKVMVVYAKADGTELAGRTYYAN